MGTERRFHHLTLEDRIKIKELVSLGRNNKQIGDYMGKSESTIFREIKAHSVNGIYDPYLAQEQMLRANAEKGPSPVLKNDADLVAFIRNLLAAGKSPERIYEILSAQDEYRTLSVPTIYRSIKAGLIPGVSMESIARKDITMLNNGMLTIPKYIRDRFAFVDGDKFSIEADESGTITIKKRIG